MSALDVLLSRIDREDCPVSIDLAAGRVRTELADDRARRIKAMVTDWTRTRVTYAVEVEKLIGLAAELIDAIDDAEVPAKKVSE